MIMYLKNLIRFYLIHKFYKRNIILGKLHILILVKLIDNMKLKWTYLNLNKLYDMIDWYIKIINWT